MSVRSTALLLVSVSLAASACKDKPADTNATPSATAAAASAAPTAKPFVDPGDDKSPASAAVLPVGKPVSAKTLAFFDLPQPTNVSKEALWSAVEAEKEGERQTALMKGDGGWVTVHFLDCRSDIVRKFAGKPLEDIGDYGFCYVTLPETFKGYPSFKKEQGSGGNAVWNADRVVRAGYIVVDASAWERPETKGADKWKLAQIDAMMSEMDWAAIAKW